MDYFQDLFNQYNQFVKANTGMATIVSLYGLALLAALRKVPTSIYYWAKRQSSTTLTFTNAGVGTNPETFNGFLRWFEASRWSRYSRSISLNGSWQSGAKKGEDGLVIGLGEGRHFFWYKRRPFWMTRKRLESGQGSMYEINYEISITCLGRQRQVIHDLIEEFRFRPNPKRVGVYTFVKDDWVRVTDVPLRSMDTVIINRTLKQTILDQITQFQANRSWYEQRGLPYKLTYLFHGIPGTGKTSLMKALACHFRMNICVVNITMMTDDTLRTAFNRAPNNCIIAVEDFESANSTAARRGLATQIPTNVKPKGVVTPESAEDADEEDPLQKMYSGGPSLHGILQTLDGLISLDGRLVFLSTNVINTLDSAITRPGRIDHIYEICALETPEVRDYIELMFPGEAYDRTRMFAPIPGCNLQQLYFEHRDDLQAFVASIPPSQDPEVVGRLLEAMRLGGTTSAPTIHSS